MDILLSLITLLLITPLPLMFVINHRKKLGIKNYWLKSFLAILSSCTIISILASFLASHIIIFILTFFLANILMAYIYYRMAQFEDEKSS